MREYPTGGKALSSGETGRKTAEIPFPGLGFRGLEGPEGLKKGFEAAVELWYKPKVSLAGQRAMYDNYLTKIFEPDTISPSQFYGKNSPLSSQMEGQRRLMLAILQDAIECLEKYRGSRNSLHRELYRDALGWVQDESADWLFCFSNVCDFLGFDAAYLRQSILARERRVGKANGKPRG